VICFSLQPEEVEKSSTDWSATAFIAALTGEDKVPAPELSQAILNTPSTMGFWLVG